MSAVTERVNLLAKAQENLNRLSIDSLVHRQNELGALIVLDELCLEFGVVADPPKTTVADKLKALRAYIYNLAFENARMKDEWTPKTTP